MKNCIAFVSVTVFLTCACTHNDDAAHNNVQESSSLSGQVYGWTTPPMDLTKCKEVVPGNNSFPKLFFLNDSSFIKAMPSTCGDLGDCTRYYFGKYKTDNEALLLTFDPQVAVFHKTSGKLASQFVEHENSEFTEERLTKRLCDNYLFFEECDVEGHLMTPKSDTLSRELQYLKENKILDKLFEIKISEDR